MIRLHVKPVRPRTNKTTIIISKYNLKRLKDIGKYGESLDGLTNMLIDFEIDQELKNNN